MTAHVRLDHCVECAQPTTNRSLICDVCEPEYVDCRASPSDEASQAFANEHGPRMIDGRLWLPARTHEADQAGTLALDTAWNTLYI